METEYEKRNNEIITIPVRLRESLANVYHAAIEVKSSKTKKDRVVNVYLFNNNLRNYKLILKEAQNLEINTSNDEDIFRDIKKRFKGERIFK